MVAKANILNNLKSLDHKFKKSSGSVRDSRFYSKLAIIELCGWIEETVDQLFIMSVNKHIKNIPHKNYLLNEMKRTYGFEYERNFRTLFIKLLGLVNFERIEMSMDPYKLVLLQSTLNTLKTKRDTQAHTHIHALTPAIDAPAVTIIFFNQAYEGLKEYERVLRTQII